MATNDSTNWLGDVTTDDGAPQRPRTEQELIDLIRDPARYPTPVRPLGSRHSMTPCMAALKVGRPGEWGTAVDVTGLTGPLRLNAARTEVTVPAGRTFHDVASELHEKHGLQFRVVTELGTLTVGAGACAATKDSSARGGAGQVCADVVGMRFIDGRGEPVELRRGQPGFEALCCSYGLFGIVTEVTLAVEPSGYVSLRHERVSLEDFERRTEEWLRQGYALFAYLFPHEEPARIVCELRRPVQAGRPSGHAALWLRNLFWRVLLHWAIRRTWLRGLVPWFVEVFLVGVLDAKAVRPVRQIVDFAKGARYKFTFSMWAFPAQGFGERLREYVALCREQAAGPDGFRSHLPHVSYHIGQDRSSLLSYSRAGDVWTIDPISPDPVEEDKAGGWKAFLDAFNEWASEGGGKPLFNQTPRLRRHHVRRAFEPALLAEFRRIRALYDPEGRLLNDYFHDLLLEEETQCASLSSMTIP